jgi:hypothetical protein
MNADELRNLKRDYLIGQLVTLADDAVNESLDIITTADKILYDLESIERTQSGDTRWLVTQKT